MCEGSSFSFRLLSRLLKIGLGTGMRRNNGGKTTNTAILTYRGKEKGGESRGPIRRQAGCVRGYCSKTENNGGDPANNSCDEVKIDLSIVLRSSL